MWCRALSVLLMIAAFALLAISCRDDEPESTIDMSRAEDELAGVADEGPSGPSGPAFGPVFYYAAPEAAGGALISVTLLVSADGGRYGLSALNVYCDDGDLGISLYYLPETSLDPVTVNVSLDGDAPLRQSWSVSRAYAATLGYDATVTEPDILFSDLAKASVAVLDIPQLGVGPAKFDLATLFSTPVQAHLERCGEEEPLEVIEPPADHQPLTVAEGKVSDRVSYRSENLRRARLQTTVTFADPNVVTRQGPVELVLTCKPDGHFNVELANLPRPRDSREVPPWDTDVVLRFDRQPASKEQWAIYSLSDGVEAHAPAPWSLMQAMVRSSTFSVSLPEFGIQAMIVDLHEMFSTPVQNNLNHCGFYTADGKG